MVNKAPKKILFLDFWSDKNRGDAIIQQALIRLARKYFPGAKVVICTEYGVNQFPEALSQFDLTLKEDYDELIGGIRFTYFPLHQSDPNNKGLRRIILNLVAYLSMGLLLLAVKVGISPSFLLKVLPPRARESFKHFIDSDLVIWNGHNFRADTFRREFPMVLPPLFHPLLCLFLKKPVACVRASIWDLRNPLIRRLVKFTFKRMFFVAVREKTSLENLNKILGPDVHHNNIALAPDPSLYVLKDIAQNIKRTSNNGRNEVKIGFTLMDWYQDGLLARSNYINALKKLIGYLLEEVKADIIIVPQVTVFVEKTDALISEVFGNVDPARISTLTSILSVEELVATYANLDFLVATRMHSAIFSWTAGTPVLSIAYDHGAKWDILKMFEVGETIIDFHEISDNLLLDKFKWVWSNRRSLLKTAHDNLQECYARVDDNMRLLKEAYGKN